MTSFRQIEANRRNARLSTGPTTEEGKRKSRRNAVRHGLTAETVIDALEDADDYAGFEMAVTSDYDARTAVERELGKPAMATAPSHRDRDWPVQNPSTALAAIQAAKSSSSRASEDHR